MTASLVKEGVSAGRQSKHVPGDDIESLLGIGMTQAVEAGQTIVVEGDPIACYFRILSGTVRLYKSLADGRRQVIDFLGAGDYFGLTGIDCYAYTVEAISPVTMIRYPRAAIGAALQAKPELAAQLYALACAELDRAQRQMLLLGRKSAEERIASFLLRLAAADGDGRVVHLPMSRQDIADHLGLTIETVSRTFSRFKRDGLIALPGRQQLELRQPERLQAMAEGELDGIAPSASAAAWTRHQMTH